MTIQLTKKDADKGQYGYCVHCSGLKTATWRESVTLHAGGDPILAPIMVTLPEFCPCQEKETAQEDDTLKSVLVDILYQVEQTNDVVRIWQQQRTQCQQIIQNALICFIKLGQPSNSDALYRIADTLNISILPSLEGLR